MKYPSSVFKSIVYGQGVTVRLICSRDEYVVEHVEKLKKKFHERGYPVELVEENLKRGVALNREDLPCYLPAEKPPQVDEVSVNKKITKLKNTGQLSILTYPIN